MSVKNYYGGNKTVSVVGNGATVKKPEIKKDTYYPGNIGITGPATSPSASSPVLGGTYGPYVNNNYNPNVVQVGGGGGVSSPASGTPGGTTKRTTDGSMIQPGAGEQVPVAQPSGSANPYENAPSSKSGQASSTSSSPSSGQGESETGKTEESSAPPMSFEEYIEELRKGRQAKLDAEKEQIENARQRAVIDAQSSYMQNLSSYGANAERMADAGMQGGGYSDYLNAQAYAQMRSDVQQANAQASYQNQAAEGTYQDYINELNQQLAQKALDDQRISDERQYNKEMLEEQRQYENDQYARQKEESSEQQRSNQYATLLEAALNPDTTLTPEAIDEFAREYGLSEQQATSLKNTLAATKSGSQKETEEQETDNTYKYYMGMIGSDAAGNSSFNIGEVDAALKTGALTEAQYNEIKDFWNKNIELSESFFMDESGNKLSFADAKKALNHEWLSEENKAALQKVFNKTYASDVAKGIAKDRKYLGDVEDQVVDIYGDDFKNSQFGSFARGKAQSDLFEAYLKDAKEGKIAVGQICTFNYGTVSGNNYGTYIYLGDGVFVKFRGASETNDDYYLPDGFKRNYNGTISRS